VIHVLTIAAFVLLLGLDTFALSAALGVAGLPAHERLRASLILTAFEAVMPCVGFVIGSGIGSAVGAFSDYAAAIVERGEPRSSGSGSGSAWMNSPLALVEGCCGSHCWYSNP